MRVLSLKPALLFLILSILAISCTNASKGDHLLVFRRCVKTCIETECAPSSTPLPLHLRLLFWNCPQNCDYECQRTVTANRIRHDQDIVQFHGKWPFLRLLGIQEPFSVFFSLLNGYAHVSGLRRLREHLPRNYPMAPYYRFLAYVGMFCWFWSAVFHTRDFVFTERMDYFGAGANVLYGLYYAPIRLFRLYRPTHKDTLRAWTWLCVAAYVAHVYYLQFIDWDYGYNMAINVVVGGLGNILWTTYSWRQYSKSKRVWAAWPGMIVTWLVAAMSLELLDFPPVLDAIDAHALWHAATIIPAVWWYHFLVRDARQDVEFGDEKVIQRVKEVKE